MFWPASSIGTMFTGTTCLSPSGPIVFRLDHAGGIHALTEERGAEQFRCPRPADRLRGVFHHVVTNRPFTEPIQVKHVADVEMTTNRGSSRAPMAASSTS